MQHPFDPTPYRGRRERLAAALRAAGGGVALLPTAPERLRNADSEYPYRHDSSFFHLTGFTEPGAWLLLDAAGRSLLLCRPRDAEREIWDGLRLGPEAAPAARAPVAQHLASAGSTAAHEKAVASRAPCFGRLVSPLRCHLFSRSEKGRY